MRKANLRAVLALGAGSAAMVAALPALAQDEIVVTAQKREQNIQDVPLSVTAIGGAGLESNGVVDISRLELLVPGLQFGQSGNDARPAIRGARTENVSNQQDPIVAFFVDGVYRSRTSQALAAFVDVNRVEVLRGPQGTLYGRNSFGGAVNVISNAPSAEFAAGINVTIGNYDQRRVDGFVNAALTDTLFARVSASIDNHDDYVENLFDDDNGVKDKDEDYVRVQLRWEPNERFDATLRASRWSQGGNGGADFGYFNAGRPVDPDATAPFTFAEVLVASLEPVNPRVGAGFSPSDPDPYTIARNADFSLDTEQETLDLEANYDLGFANLKVLLGYADFSSNRTADADLSIFNSGFEFQEDRARTYSEEIQLTSQGDGPLEWTLGGFFLQDDTVGIFAFDRIFATDAATNLPILTTPAPAGSDFNSLADVDTRSIAFYGQATYSITDAIRITGGLRWTQDKKDFSRVTNSNFTIPLNFTGSTVFTDSATFDKLTWKAGVDFDLTPNNLLYATASTGFQAGGFNNSANSVTGGASFDEQTIKAYEVGLKNTFLDGAVVANVALFLNKFDGLLANEFVNVGSTVLTISTNAGEAEAYGAEAEIKWSPVDAALINILASYNKAEFGRYNISEPISGASVNLDGRRVPLSPEFTFGIGAQYDFPAFGGTITPAGNLYYSSSYSTNDIDYAFSEQDAYAKLDLRLTYTSPSDNWYVELFGRNVTDEAILNRTVRFGQNAIAQNYGDPATYGIRFGFRN